MMEFFEGLMKQVMQKQESMQQRFLEAIEKREQERMMREEAWKRQEMARLAREHELMAQERSIAASRDAAIVSFLQKITGQTIQLHPSTTTVPAPPPQPQPTSHVTAPAPPSQPPPPPQPAHQPQQQQPQLIRQQHPPPQSTAQVVGGSSTSTVMAVVPEEQQVQAPPTQEITTESPISSSRWPKAEVLALIKIRSGLEPRYQEAGPKGPLWEEISAAMLRIGFKRNAKRCKEKWENINKYYKKVKESNKNRPEDAKTCPYFHELDALYRQKILGGGSSTSSAAATNVAGAAASQLHYPQNPAAGEQQQHRHHQPQPSIQSGHQRDNQNGNNNAGDQAATKAGTLFVEQGSSTAGQPHNKVNNFYYMHIDQSS